MAQEQDLGDLKEEDVGDLIKSDHGTVYFMAHFCPVAFFRQMIALKITFKKNHF
jgi:hypothetical protein